MLQMLHWCQDLADGMSCLQRASVIIDNCEFLLCLVHMDLALRNVLVTNERDQIVAKVSDFGMVDIHQLSTADIFWETDPTLQPTFSDILHRVSRIIQKCEDQHHYSTVDEIL